MQDFGQDRRGIPLADLHAQHLAPTVAVDADRGDNRDWQHAVAAPDLQAAAIHKYSQSDTSNYRHFVDGRAAI